MEHLTIKILNSLLNIQEVEFQVQSYFRLLMHNAIFRALFFSKWTFKSSVNNHFPNEIKLYLRSCKIRIVIVYGKAPPSKKKSFFLPNLMICSSSVLIVNQSLGSPHTGAKSSFGDRIWGEAEITADSDCSHQVKRCLLPGRKIMTNLDSILKSKDNHFADKGRYGQSCGFSSSHVRM